MSAEHEIPYSKPPRKRRGRIIAGGLAAGVLVAGGGVAISLVNNREDNAEQWAPVSPTVGITETVEPTSSFSSSSSLPSESASASSFPSAETSPSAEINTVPESVLDVVPALGLLTYTGGANIDTPYASGVALSTNHFLTSADLFGPRPEDTSVLCGDFRGTTYKYQINTGVEEHNVVSIRRHPDTTKNLAILTVDTPFETIVPYKQVADVATSGPVYEMNFQSQPDSTPRSPITGAAIFAGDLSSPSLDTPTSVDNDYYGSRDWKTAVVTTTDDFGFDDETGQRDTTQEGYAGKTGSGGPVVTARGTIVGIQTAPTADGQVPGFLATRVTKQDVSAIMSTSPQKC